MLDDVLDRWILDREVRDRKVPQQAGGHLGSVGPRDPTRRSPPALRFSPLLLRRVGIATVSRNHPTIMVDIDSNGRSNWSGLVSALAASQRPNAQRPATAFSEMRIDNGTVVLRDAAAKITETLNDVQFSLAWPSTSKSFSPTGRVLRRGDPLDPATARGHPPPRPRIQRHGKAVDGDRLDRLEGGMAEVRYHRLLDLGRRDVRAGGDRHPPARAIAGAVRR